MRVARDSPKERDSVVTVWEWLRAVVPATIFNSCPTVDVVAKFKEYEQRARRVKDSADNGGASHIELREMMYLVCEEAKWWDWRMANSASRRSPDCPFFGKTDRPVRDDRRMLEVSSGCARPRVR